MIEIAELTPEDIYRSGSAALLPFLPLTKGGVEREVVSSMLDKLISQQKEELAEVGFTFAWLMFKQKSPQHVEWLKLRYKNMFDILREEPLYSEILQEGREEGIALGIEEGKIKGKIEGKIEALQHTAMRAVTTKFPQLEQLARQQVAACREENVLDDLIVAVYTTRDERIVERLLTSISTRVGRVIGPECPGEDGNL